MIPNACQIQRQDPSAVIMMPISHPPGLTFTGQAYQTMAAFSGSPIPDAPCVCDCRHSNSQLVGEIIQATEGLDLDPSPPPAQSRTVALDDALILGRRLALEWERVNGCFNVDEHLDAAALLTMSDAIERLLGMYQILLENTLSRHASRAAVRSANPSPAADRNYPPASSYRVTPVAIVLGPMELNEEEAGIVAQEALRHMISRMGDMLKDIEEEGRKAMEDAGSSSESDVIVGVKRAQGLMFRVLGRIPR